jgi:hypothetical protein
VVDVGFILIVLSFTLRAFLSDNRSSSGYSYCAVVDCACAAALDSVGTLSVVSCCRCEAYQLETSKVVVCVL